jgi:hypothetical protein
MIEVNNKLTNLQLELLKLFQFELDDKQLLEIRTLLAKYFAERGSAGMDKLWDERGWTAATMEQWLNEHNRSSNK